MGLFDDLKGKVDLSKIDLSKIDLSKIDDSKIEEVKKFVADAAGKIDIEAIAKKFGIPEDAVKKIVESIKKD